VREELERWKWEVFISLPFTFHRTGERVKICGLSLECDGKASLKRKRRERKGSDCDSRDGGFRVWNFGFALRNVSGEMKRKFGVSVRGYNVLY